MTTIKDLIAQYKKTEDKKGKKKEEKKKAI